jgi:hypothetical protein
MVVLHRTVHHNILIHYTLYYYTVHYTPYIHTIYMHHTLLTGGAQSAIMSTFGRVSPLGTEITQET